MTVHQAFQDDIGQPSLKVAGEATLKQRGNITDIEGQHGDGDLDPPLLQVPAQQAKEEMLKGVDLNLLPPGPVFGDEVHHQGFIALPGFVTTALTEGTEGYSTITAST